MESTCGNIEVFNENWKQLIIKIDLKFDFIMSMKTLDTREANGRKWLDIKYLQGKSEQLLDAP